MDRGRSTRARMRSRRWITFVALCVAGLAFVALGAAPASASTTTLSSATTLSGVSTLASQPFDKTLLGVNATGTAQIKLHWNQAATLGTAFDPNLVRQGRSLDPSDSYARTLPGTMSVDYTLTNLQVAWDGIGPLNMGSPGFTTSGTCDLKANTSDYLCHLESSQAGLLDPGFPYAGPYVRLEVDSDITVTPEGLATVRNATFGGNPDGTNGLTLGETPIVDPLAIPCSVGSGDELVYSLGQLSSSPGISMETSLVFDVGAAFPDPIVPFLEDHVQFADPSIAMGTTTGSIDMIGNGATFDLGAVQHNNIPPNVDAGGAYTGNEGSAVSFDGSASSSICGFPTLRWDFSDGGVGFGKFPQHTFADNGVFSGLLTATDATGLVSTTTFTIDVANLPPSVDGGPDKSALWGVPVAFHANGSDPGSIDLGSLLYSWNFHDPASPVGAVGADVFHTFANPGSYAVDVNVRDKDNAAVTDTVGVTILKRGTTAGYSGQLQATPSKIVSLSGSVTDQLGQPVPGRTVTFTLGSQSTTAVTNSAGVATASLKLTQKQGSYPVSMAFAGDGLYVSSSSSTTFTIGK